MRYNCPITLIHQGKEVKLQFDRHVSMPSSEAVKLVEIVDSDFLASGGSRMYQESAVPGVFVPINEESGRLLPHKPSAEYTGMFGFMWIIEDGRLRVAGHVQKT